MHLPNFGHDLGKVVGIQAPVRYWERARGRGILLRYGTYPRCAQGEPGHSEDVLRDRKMADNRTVQLALKNSYAGNKPQHITHPFRGTFSPNSSGMALDVQIFGRCSQNYIR